MNIEWPSETAVEENSTEPHWLHPESNILLDFHGNPQKAKLTVLSDGNHHMALESALKAFVKKFPAVEDVFYVTLPPSVLLKIIQHSKIHVGNFTMTVRGDILISPNQFVSRVKCNKQFPFAKNKGSVLLVNSKNQKNIASVNDLLRDDVSLFISNPVTERVSHLNYRETICQVMKNMNLDYMSMLERIDGGVGNVIYGEKIHHREAPSYLRKNLCDVAIVYHHLALRYVKLFPNNFEIIPLDGKTQDPTLVSGNITNQLSIGALNSENPWTEKALAFLLSETTKTIYDNHGLDCRAIDCPTTV